MNISKYIIMKKVNKCKKYWGDQIDANLHLETIDNDCSKDIKQKIEFYYIRFKKGFSIRVENS